MKIAHIAPVTLLEMVRPQEYHLALTSRVLRSSHYRKFYQTVGERAFVVLDVDAFESRGDPTPLLQVLRAAEAVDPSEVTLPDVWGGSAELTIRLAQEAITVFRNRHWPLMGVPHGRDFVRYMWCAEQLVRLGATTLGIYEETYSDFLVKRSAVVRTISREIPHVQIHLLGCLEDLSDILDPEVRSLVRGMDTCKFVRWGLEGQCVTASHIPPYPGRGERYFYRSADTFQRACIEHNIQYWNNFVR